MRGSGQGAISPPKIMNGTRSLGDPQHSVVLLTFKVIESRKIVDGPLTMVMRPKMAPFTLVIAAALHICATTCKNHQNDM